MSRLESFIRRLTAQRDILDLICRDMELGDGPVIELGLGNGRTYDHLRERLPGRRIIAFDRACQANRKSLPPDCDLILGEITETARPFIGVNAALVHADIGSGYDDLDELNLRWLPQLIVDLLRPSGIAASGVRLSHPQLHPLPLPDDIRPGRYFLYRRC
jgi:trans-aconitate methyltransferase